MGAALAILSKHELEDPRFVANTPDRCYFCKAELFTVLRRLAEQEGIVHVLYGAIPEDLNDVVARVACFLGSGQAKSPGSER